MKGILTLFTVFGMDFLTKKWAEESLPLNEKREFVKNHLCFWHIKNTGIAYNRFSGKRKGILFFTGGLLAYYSGVFFQTLRGKRNGKSVLPIALILGGGYGNFLERMRKGRVTDFLYIPVKGKNAPIFNIADVAIWMGALWLAIVSCDEK